ncbi:MAG: AraC family transcriptional activator of pyochelin receptor [Flavobacteriaceae bacterium]|jgi:AraC family transcriptional activator of pyochelin receptor
MEDKNNALSPFEEIYIEEGFYVLKIQNNSPLPMRLSKEIDSSYIQFHFCLKGSADFLFNEDSYSLSVSEEQSLLLYNTQKDLPLNLHLQPNAWLFSVVMTLRKFHTLFSKEAHIIPFLSQENKDQKYYAQEAVSPSIAVIISQLMNFSMHPSIKELYTKAKVYELMALYFNRSEEADTAQCPFLVDEENVKRIRKAKEIIIARMAEPPSLQELADEIGLSLRKLKEGFKQVYGDSVYSFLFDYKMEYGRKLLVSGAYNVNEVGLKIGYSTASHYIAAFRKKYGTTPKKYLTAATTNNIS